MERPGERAYSPDAQQIAPPRAARLHLTLLELVTNPDARERLRVVARWREGE